MADAQFDVLMMAYRDMPPDFDPPISTDGDVVSCDIVCGIGEGPYKGERVRIALGFKLDIATNDKALSSLRGAIWHAQEMARLGHRDKILGRE